MKKNKQIYVNDKNDQKHRLKWYRVRKIEMVQDSNTFLLNANYRLLSIRLSRNWIILGFR